jgi:predicted ArsR family transcriptional regulator
MSRHTVAQAADMLGITTGAVRNRLSRKTLGSVKDAGRVYVLLPRRSSDTSRYAARHTDRDAADTPGGTSEAGPGEAEDRTAELIATLREQLAAERQAHAEARRIIAGLVERMPPAIEAPATERVHPEPPSDERGPPQAGGGAPSGGTTPGDRERPARRPSWWQRFWRS